jgi:chromosome partitioning protein
MAVLSFVSSKGGAGKTTLALAVASVLSRRGAVIMIDADRNAPLVQWANLGQLPQEITVRAESRESAILKAIAAAAAVAPWVIVDTEGSASLTSAYAVASADAVIIPCQPATADATEAARTVEMVRQQGQIARRHIPHAIVFTRTPLVARTRSYGAVRAELEAAEIPVAQTVIADREALRLPQAYGVPLHALELEVAPGRDKATAEIEALTDEILAMMMEGAHDQSQAHA